ncbi:hypothetical protein F4818DRAFT_440321 [Hypoxylon cercidicola]|nr:hypothetical protein F4818DRAFT_440321 [Hypoxylon cercidicola]
MGDSPDDRRYSISAVDGPTSRLPSSSVASVATTNRASRQNMKESFKSAPATPNSNSSYVDPPRPAKEGHEWVWFPAGYWAEREVIEAPGKAIKLFKWRKRSGKSSSGRAAEDDPEQFWDQMQRTPGVPSLPTSFIAEEGPNHLQQRSPCNRHGTSSESGGYSFPLLRTPQAELPSPYLTEEAHVQSLQRSPLTHHTNSHTNSSESATSLSKQTRPLQSSPLTIIEKGYSDTTPTPIQTHILSTVKIPISRSGTSLSPFLHRSRATTDDKPKKSFMARLLPEHKPKMKNTHSDNDVHDYTAHIIEGAHARLVTHHSQSSTPMPIMSRVASLLTREEGGGGAKRPWARSLKLFGKSPWHRQESAGSEASASSSLRDVLRGRTPAGSPASDIELLKPRCCEFPGGEASRIQTPPLRESGEHRGQPRSFFFDIATPPPRDGKGGDDNRTSPYNNKSGGSSSSRDCQSCRRRHSPPPTVVDGGRDADADADGRERDRRRRRKRDSGKEWWEVPVALPRYEAMAPASFEFDMPEHLPSSPMCPANTRHKSGGTGVCVYHGRRKRSGVQERSDEENDDTTDVWT